MQQPRYENCLHVFNLGISLYIFSLRFALLMFCVTTCRVIVLFMFFIADRVNESFISIFSGTSQYTRREVLFTMINHAREIANTQWLDASHDNAVAPAFRTVNRRFAKDMAHGPSF